MDVTVLPEPLMVFGHEQGHERPQHGLATFGPCDRDAPSRPQALRYGIVGTEEGISRSLAFLDRMRGPLIPSEDLSLDLWPAFPGFEAAFECELPGASWTAVLDDQALDRAARIGDAHDRAFAVVDKYLEPIANLKQRDERIDVVFCIVPEQVYRNCRPMSSVPARKRSRATLSAERRKLLSLGQMDLLDPQALRRREFSVDFRRQLKARAMPLGLPIQILRDTTLRLEDQNPNPNLRSLTPMADRAWNMGTALYYKAGGRPWRLASARRGVCYVGLAFRLQDPRNPKSNSAVCAAQMFLEDGDGIVFKGEFGPWYSDESRSFHLSEESAADLLRGVLETYRRLGGSELSEVFLHSRSRFNDDEWAGYSRACPEGTRLTGIRVRGERAGGIKLFRPGTRPVVRGTFWPMTERSGFLWGSGFVPEVGQYAGSEVPLPLRVDILRGEGDLQTVVSDVFGLTKLNYNACKIGRREPVTVGFSDAVGEILVANPTSTAAQPQFRYYI